MNGALTALAIALESELQVGNQALRPEMQEPLLRSIFVFLKTETQNAVLVRDSLLFSKEVRPSTRYIETAWLLVGIGHHLQVARAKLSPDA